MSSGQKAWEDEVAEQVFAEHKARIEALGSFKIICVVNDLADAVNRLEALAPALPRAGWHYLDQIKSLLSHLK